MDAAGLRLLCAGPYSKGATILQTRVGVVSVGKRIVVFGENREFLVLLPGTRQGTGMHLHRSNGSHPQLGLEGDQPREFH